MLFDRPGECQSQVNSCCQSNVLSPVCIILDPPVYSGFFPISISKTKINFETQKNA